MKAIKTLRLHNITLQGQQVLLRPLTEGDWELLTKWNSDQEILYFTEGEKVARYRPEEVQHIYRSVSQTAFCFIIELNGPPIGECWLQKMNLERVLQRWPNQDCRRIDLMIGDKGLWGQGIGTVVIGLLAAFGFEREKADAIFACDVADYNTRSLKAFRKAGFQVDATMQESPGDKARYRYDLVLTRRKWNEARRDQ